MDSRFGAVLEEFEVKDALMAAYAKKGNGVTIPATYNTIAE